MSTMRTKKLEGHDLYALKAPWADWPAGTLLQSTFTGESHDEKDPVWVDPVRLKQLVDDGAATPVVGTPPPVQAPRLVPSMPPPAPAKIEAPAPAEAHPPASDHAAPKEG